MMIRGAMLLRILAAKWERRPCRSYYVKLSNGRIARFVDWNG